jgi:chaperone modulatory protein CbpM
MTRNAQVCTGILIDEELCVSFAELCRFCDVDADLVVDMVREGVIEPAGGERESWQFHGIAVRRAQVVVRLIRDLDLNLPGAALALELLEELEAARRGFPNR